MLISIFMYARAMKNESYDEYSKISELKSLHPKNMYWSPDHNKDHYNHNHMYTHPPEVH